MGPDPLTEKALVIKDGRFGPYVTDGETNASLRQGQSPESLTIEAASEMLAEKRAKGPATPVKKATRPAAKKAAPAKAATAKATPAKKTAKKAATKKAAPRKKS
jgi:DNA topoisomerase-1